MTKELTIYGLTLWQPWASLMGPEEWAKQIETRSWSTSYRGWVAIHAAKRFPSEAKSLCWRPPYREALLNAGIASERQELWGIVPVVSALPLGAIVAVGRLQICVSTNGTWSRWQGVHLPPPEPERSFGDYSPNRYAWVFGDLRRLPKSIPCKGGQQLWRPQPDVIDRLTAFIGEAA